MANNKIKRYYFKDIAWKEVKFYYVHFTALKFQNSSKTVGTNIVVRIWERLRPTQLSKFKFDIGVSI